MEEAFHAWRHALELRDRHIAHVLVVRTVQHAAAQIAQIARLQPYNAEMQRSAAVALLATGEQEGAISHMRAALRLDPSADVQQQAGQMFAPSRPKEAAALLRVAVRVHRHCHALAYLTLARLECSAHGEAGDVCARGWLQAFQCATAAELPDPELLDRGDQNVRELTDRPFAFVTAGGAAAKCEEESGKERAAYCTALGNHNLWPVRALKHCALYALYSWGGCSDSAKRTF